MPYELWWSSCKYSEEKMTITTVSVVRICVVRAWLRNAIICSCRIAWTFGQPTITDTVCFLVAVGIGVGVGVGDGVLCVCCSSWSMRSSRFDLKMTWIWVFLTSQWREVECFLWFVGLFMPPESHTPNASRIRLNLPPTHKQHSVLQLLFVGWAFVVWAHRLLRYTGRFVARPRCGVRRQRCCFDTWMCHLDVTLGCCVADRRQNCVCVCHCNVKLFFFVSELDVIGMYIQPRFRSCPGECEGEGKEASLSWTGLTFFQSLLRFFGLFFLSVRLYRRLGCPLNGSTGFSFFQTGLLQIHSWQHRLVQASLLSPTYLVPSRVPYNLNFVIRCAVSSSEYGRVQLVWY